MKIKIPFLRILRKLKFKFKVPWQVIFVLDYVLSKIPVIDFLVYYRRWAKIYKKRYGGR